MNLFQSIKLIYILFGKNTYPNLQEIEKIGLLAVKITQIYALRSDFLSPEKCKHFQSLYQRNTSIPTEDFFKLYEEYAPNQLKENIQEIHHQPLATASIGQVHTAVLKNGKTVVLKVLKKNFKPNFIRDIKSLKKILSFILFFYPKLKKLADPIGTLNTLKKLTLTELNLLNEIHGIERLQIIKNESISIFPYLKRLQFPHVYKEYSNENILVSDLIEGKSVHTLLSEKKLPYSALLDLFRIQGFFLFLKGEFHGDLHPGNVFFSNGHFTFLDNANIEEIPSYFSQGLLILLKNISEKEYTTMAKTLHSLSKKKLTEKKLTQFSNAIEHLYKDFHSKSVSEVSLTQKMMETIKLSIHSGMEFEEGMFGIIKSLMYLDGMVIECNPNAHLMEDLVPFMKDFDTLQRNHSS